MINPELPSQGEKPWGPKLNAAIEEIVDEVNSLSVGAVDLGEDFVQASPAASWAIPFPAGLTRRPSVTVRDIGGNVVIVEDTADLAARMVYISFPIPFAGTATLN